MIMSVGLPALKVTTPRAPHHLRSFISKEFSSCKLTNFSFTLTDSDPQLLPSQPTPKSVSPPKDFRRRGRPAEPETLDRDAQDACTQTVQVAQVEVRKKEATQGFDPYVGS